MGKFTDEVEKQDLQQKFETVLEPTLSEKKEYRLNRNNHSVELCKTLKNFTKFERNNYGKMLFSKVAY